ncbi:type I-F CRISPR-associated protein Csy2 [Halomonas sp. EGI 63088]|uniref:Type I-F CRISPR-associated protein Csy2 n=1 Tax=Halomonas flagellata TaxID=2920385 RepID=A0ABS9RZG3_9GAMM|nr:type I-F CRISPR-associated protein Csy2 [Halomonas flagellata]MCH4565216.1 type I-F CRISPR-associated protein Csy2 [Halomonas flagellata]
MNEIKNLLILPHLRVQNANAISSPMTWGFPAMSAFVGLMHALERKLPEHLELEFQGVGVICHDYQAQASRGGFTRSFHLTRNPVDKSGKTAAIVEEGRIHLEITLVFAVSGEACHGDEEGQRVAREVAEIVSGMRIAGGSVVPAPLGEEPRQHPWLERLDDDLEARALRFRRLRRRWLPGFALVCRDDLLTRRLAEMREESSEATVLDAWLDMSRLNHECRLTETENTEGELREEVSWEIRRPPGWLVPIPVGYGAISRLFEPGEVASARDAVTPFRFVESLYTIGQWISPHRLSSPEELLWYVDNDLDAGLYRLANKFPARHTATQ